MHNISCLIVALCANNLRVGFTATGRSWNIQEESVNFWYLCHVSIFILLTNYLFVGGYVIKSCHSCVGIANWTFACLTHFSIFSDPANANALKLTSELLRIFITGSYILKEKHIWDSLVMTITLHIIFIISTTTFLLMQRLFNVLLLLQKQRVLVK